MFVMEKEQKVEGRRYGVKMEGNCNFTAAEMYAWSRKWKINYCYKLTLL